MEVIFVDQEIQKLRLIVNGAVSLYEGQGLEIAQILQRQGRDELLTVMDAITTALYWMQDILEIKEMA